MLARPIRHAVVRGKQLIDVRLRALGPWMLLEVGVYGVSREALNA